VPPLPLPPSLSLSLHFAGPHSWQWGAGREWWQHIGVAVVRRW
jgi:hypothetical protein